MRPLWHVWAMLRSLRHGRPLLNGYASYYPAGWDTRMATAGRLSDAKALASLVRETGVTTIVVRLDSLPELVQSRWQLPLSPPMPGLVPVRTLNDVLVFRVDARAAPEPRNCSDLVRKPGNRHPAPFARTKPARAIIRSHRRMVERVSRVVQ